MSENTPERTLILSTIHSKEKSCIVKNTRLDYDLSERQVVVLHATSTDWEACEAPNMSRLFPVTICLLGVILLCLFVDNVRVPSFLSSCHVV